MILGIGNDIVEITRIEKAISNEKFKKRVYTEKEIEITEKKAVKLPVMLEDFQQKKQYLKHWEQG